MTALSAADFRSWIDSLPMDSGFARISPVRAYAHAEEKYDAQYGIVSEHPEEGSGLCALLKFQSLDSTGPGIEIGCGSGHLTTGLAKAYPGADLLVTDASAAFLRLTKDRISTHKDITTRLHYAVLNGDDLSLLPQGFFSLIALRSTLHHILNVEGFISDCARALRPGGTIAMGAEPCESGYVLMGSVAQAITPALALAGIQLTPKWVESVRMMAETMKFYCRRDIDKTLAEDKHLFRVYELAELGARYGLVLRYFANTAFRDFVESGTPQPSHTKFSIFFLTYLRYCMGFEVDFVELIRKHMQSQLNYIDECYPTHVGPLFTGTFLFTKVAGTA